MRKKKKDEIGMCQRQRNTCKKRKKMKQVCARGKGIHVRKGKIEIKRKALNEKCTAGGKGYKGFTI